MEGRRTLFRLVAASALVALAVPGSALGQDDEDERDRKVPDVVRVWLVDFVGQPDDPPGNYEVVHDRLGQAPQKITNFDDGCGAGLSGIEWKDCRPHWPDAFTEKNWPLAYVRSARVVVKEARFKVRADVPLANVTVVGTADLGSGVTLRFEQAAVNQVGDELIIADVRADRDLPDTVAVLEKMRIRWRVESAGTSLRAGASDHPVFVVYGAPTAMPYMTQLDFTTHAASGLDDERRVVEAVWTTYQTRAIERRELTPKSGDIGHHGAVLSYWTPWSMLADVSRQFRCPLVFTTEMLLQEAVGRCGGWATFMRDSLAIHGIAAPNVRVSTLAGFPSGPAGADVMLIKRWSFAATPTGAGDFQFLTEVQQLRTPAGAVTGTYVGTPQARDELGLPGQGNPSPPGWFEVGDHAVVKYGGEIYDPSYGTGPFPDIAAWAQASLDGYAKFTLAPPVLQPNGSVLIRATMEAHRGVP